MDKDKMNALKQLIANIVNSNADKSITDGRYQDISRFDTVIGDEELSMVGYNIPYRRNEEMSYSELWITTRHLDIDTDTLTVTLDHRVQKLECDASNWHQVHNQHLRMLQSLMRPGIFSKVFQAALEDEKIIISNNLKNVLNATHVLADFSASHGDSLFTGRLIEVPEGTALYLSFSARIDGRPFITFKMSTRLYYNWFMVE